MAAIPKKINLALQGGGAHGAFAWGVIDFLLQDPRIEIDSISATSAGAMNAAVVAQGMVNGGSEGARQALFQFWRDISDYGKYLSPVKLSYFESMLGLTAEKSYSYFMFDLMTKLLSPYQFNPFNYNPLKEVLEKNVDFAQVRSCDRIKLFICATNVQTGKVKIFKNEDITSNAILASACLPFLFQAVEVDSEYYWDGGYMGNPAIFPLIYNSKVNDVLIIHINPIVREEVPTNAGDILNRINEISFNSSLMREMRAIAFVTKMLDNNWIKEEHCEKIKRIFIHSIRADKFMAEFSVASKFSADWDFLIKLFELGQKTGEEWLHNNYDKIGQQSSIQIEEYL